MSCFGFFNCLRTKRKNSKKKQEHSNGDIEETIQSSKVQGQSFTLFKCFRTKKNSKNRKNTNKQEHQNVAVTEHFQSPDAHEVVGDQMANRPSDELKKGRLEVLERGSWGNNQQRVSRNVVQLTPRYNQPRAAKEPCITIGFKLSPAWKEWSNWEESSLILPPGHNLQCFQLRNNPETMPFQISLPEAQRVTSYYQDLLFKRWASDCKKYTFQNINNSTFSVHGHGLRKESLGISTNEMVTVNSSVSPTLNWHKLRSILLEIRSDRDMIYISSHMKPSGSATQKRDLEYPLVLSGSRGCQLNWSEAGSFAGDTEVFRRPAGNQAKGIRSGGCHDLLSLSKACEKGSLSVGGIKMIGIKTLYVAFLQAYWNKVSYFPKEMCELKTMVVEILYWSKTKAFGNGSGHRSLSIANACGSQLISGSRAAVGGTVYLLNLVKAGTFGGVDNLNHWTKAGFSRGTQIFLDHAFVGGFLQDYWNKVHFGNFTKKVLLLKAVFPHCTQTEALGNYISQIRWFKANAFEGAALQMCGFKAAIANVTCLLNSAKDRALGGCTELVHWTTAGCGGGPQLFQWNIGRHVRRGSILILEYTFGRQGPQTLFLVLPCLLLAFGMLRLFRVIDATEALVQ